MTRMTWDKMENELKLWFELLMIIFNEEIMTSFKTNQSKERGWQQMDSCMEEKFVLAEVTASWHEILSDDHNKFPIWLFSVSTKFAELVMFQVMQLIVIVLFVTWLILHSFLSCKAICFQDTSLKYDFLYGSQTNPWIA